jgi:hypothetical protein
LPVSQKCRPQGLATLSAVSAPKTLEGVFQPPHALGISPSELFSFRAISDPVSGNLSLPALPAKTFRASTVCSKGSSPPEKPCPFSLPERLIRGGTVCSPEVPGLPGSPRVRPRRRASPSSPSPHALRQSLRFHKLRSGPQGIAARTQRLFPPKGAPTCLAFLTDGSVPPLRKRPRCGLFFHLEIQGTLTSPRNLS